MTQAPPPHHGLRPAARRPLLLQKFRTKLARVFPESRAAAIEALCLDAKRLSAKPVHEFVDMMVL